MFDAPPRKPTTVFASVPPELQMKGKKTAYLESRDRGLPPSFLEGPSFDRDGNLYCVDIPYGRVFRVSPAGTFSLIVEYDGEPNGLKLHKDGRIFIADKKRGIMVLDPGSKEIRPYFNRINSEGLKGPNDLVFAPNGDLYFTDQGESGWQDPSGRIIRVTADGKADIVLQNIPSPNGIAIDPAGKTLYIAISRANAIWKAPLRSNGTTSKVMTYIHLSGGKGPDGLAVDVDDNLCVCHSGLGCVWQFNKFGEPIARIVACTGGRSTTNLAYGGKDNKTIYITDSSTGSILTADLDTPGLPMYGLS